MTEDEQERHGPGQEGAHASAADVGAERESGGGHRRGGLRRGRPRKQRSFWIELPILVVVALLLALVIKTFFVQAFSIPSGSMEQTLRIHDRVLVDKFTPWFGAKPERGDVIVFHDPGGWLTPAETPKHDTGVMGTVQDVLSFIGLMPSANEKDLIKRVIAVGGDTVQCKNPDGPVYVNGKALSETSYVYPGVAPCGGMKFGPVKVPKNRLWVMGDHRNASADSRFHQNMPGGGTIPVKDVVGRAFAVAWPIDHWSILHVPSTFHQPGIDGKKASAGSEVTSRVMGATPFGLGVLGTLPLAWWRRRKLRR